MLRQGSKRMIAGFLAALSLSLVIYGVLFVAPPWTPLVTETVADDNVAWALFPDPASPEDPWPRSAESKAVLASPACQYDNTGDPVASLRRILATCFPVVDVNHVMRDRHGNGCGVPSQIGGRCLCEAELPADRAKCAQQEADGIVFQNPCKVLFLAAAITTGPIVEFGTWCGHSTRCLAAGAGVAGVPDRVHGCDFFKAYSDFTKLRFSTFWAANTNANTDILPIFKLLTTGFDPTVRYHRGNCHKLSPGSWNGGKLSIFSTDASKNDASFVADFERVWQHFERGTILILADFVAIPSSNPDFVYARLVERGFLEAVFFSDFTSHAVFIVLKPFEADTVAFFDRRRYSTEDIERVYARYLDDYNRITTSLQASASGRKKFQDFIGAQHQNALKAYLKVYEKN